MRYLFFFLVIISANILASTISEVNGILAARENVVNPVGKQEAELTEKNGALGASIDNLQNKYEFILFYRATCTHCQKFDPVLAEYSSVSHISVKAFTFDEPLPDFPNSTHIDRNAAIEYFGSNDIAVPALFIMNKDNLHLYPV